MAEKIKILGIAPYDGMKVLMMRVAKANPDIELEVFVGDLEKGVQIAKQNFHSNYDIIISRGGTAKLIEKAVPIPVVEVSFSPYDILRAIKLAENYSDLYAIVGFPGITDSANLLCDLLQYDINIYTINNATEAERTLKKLSNKGYKMVLCDMITNTIANKMGLKSILILSGKESVQNAFEQAKKISRTFSNIREEKKFLETVISKQSNAVVVYNSSNKIIFSTFLESSSKIEQKFDSILPIAREHDSHKFFKRINGKLYSCISSQIILHGETHIVIYINPSAIPLSDNKYGIKYTNRTDAQARRSDGFSNIFDMTAEIKSDFEVLNESNYPVMIIGENGTGAEEVATNLFLNSSSSENPFIIIDCSVLNEKGWKFTTNHYNSPFNDNNNTIFIKDINFLDELRQKLLLSILIDTNLCKRNRVIMSSICNPDGTMSEMGNIYVNTLSCLVLRLPSLRNKVDVIPTISSLYLSRLNTQLGKQIVGFEEEAMNALKKYDWPHNYTQLERVIRELVVTSNDLYISTSAVLEILHKESLNVYSSPHLSQNNNTLQQEIGVPCNSTLEEMNRIIIRKILEINNNNQSVSAKKLGISRTTLWRILKD